MVSNTITFVTITLAHSKVFGIFCSIDAEYWPDVSNTTDIKKAQPVI